MKRSDHDLAVLVAPMLVDADLTSKYWLETRWEYLRDVIRILKSRARRLSDFVEMGGYFFSFEGKYDEAAAKKNFSPEAADLLDTLAERFEGLDNFTEEAAEQALTRLAEERDIKKAKLIHPTRLAVSGVPAGPGLYEMLVVLSQPIVVKRMRQAAQYIRTANK
jgi:glutamyl-tRNA synthetase